MTLPVTLATPGISLGVGVVTSGNIGHLAFDSSGNIYTSDFTSRIVRVDAAGTTAQDVVNVVGTPPCDPSQSGIIGDLPAFRGFVFDTNGDLYVSGYCLDNVYRFTQAELDTAWTTGTPISTLPAPVFENPSAALDGPDFNGTFGMAFWVGVTPPVPTCMGLPATILGTPGNDVLIGTSGDDVILAYAGDDVLYAGAGIDTICGGDGDDDLGWAAVGGRVVTREPGGGSSSGMNVRRSLLKCFYTQFGT